MEEHWEKIKNAADHSWGLFFIFMVGCSTCNYTMEIKSSQEKIIQQNEIIISTLKSINSIQENKLINK